MTSSLPRLTRAQVREIDRLAVERYGLPGIVLMENAAIGASNVAWEMLRSVCEFRRADVGGRVSRRNRRSDWSAGFGDVAPDVLILCGGGNNGGDGLAVARHLHNRGCRIRIALTIEPEKYTADAAINWRVCGNMRIPIAPFDPAAVGRPDLIVDAVFGTGLTRAPRDPFPRLAAAVNAAGVPILAIDLPSGLDCDTGQPLGPAVIRATRTVTFVAEKAGFAAPAAAGFLGRVEIATIGCPRELIEEMTGP
jgi:hydroxyethylthiazole kinase-like uncharacterized protein yjeF